MIKQKHSHHQQGLTLVELMIALALSSFLLMGVFQIFSSNHRMTQINQAFGQVQESGRIGIELITRNIRMADFWGCVTDTSKITNHLDSPGAAHDYTNAEGVSGANDVNGLTITGKTDSGAAITVTVKPGTDTLTLKGSTGASGVKILAPYMNVNAATIHVNTGITNLPKGKILLISDCNGGDVFTNTHENTKTSGNINHNTGNVGGGAIDNYIKDLSHTYNGSAQILVPFSKSYFVGENDADGFSLFQNEDNVISELVRNVTDIQFTYGEDTTDDGNVDTFNAANTVTDMENVRSIKISFTTEAGSNIDAGEPMARTYTVTTNIRNRTLQ